LFPASIGKTGKLSRRPLVRTDAADMLKRRLKQAGLPAHYSPHSFRATGITNFLEAAHQLAEPVFKPILCNRAFVLAADIQSQGLWPKVALRIGTADFKAGQMI
jgi:hypothetical protein